MINVLEVEINYLKGLEEQIRERRQYLENELRHKTFKAILENMEREP